MRFERNPKEFSRRVLWVAVSIAVAWILVYIILYWYQPFSEFWNNFLSNFSTQAASFIAAIFATMIWKRYEKSDTPRRVWGPFAIALWLWFAGELAWGYLYMAVGEVPIGLPDMFWISSYIFLGLALVNQYRILVPSDTRAVGIRVLIAILSLLALTLLIFRFLTSVTDATEIPDAVVNSFYPAADFVLALIALWLAHNFMGGAFSKPWFGLLVFSFSDLMYAWLEASGIYAWSLEQGNLLTTIADVAYFGAYLVLGIAVLYQWLFLKYGLRIQSDAR